MSQTQTSGSSDDAQDDDGPDEGGGGSITLTLGDQEIVLRQRYELISIINEIGIAIFFTVGSIAFYFEELFTLGVTLFVIGSVQLGVRPAIRFARRVQLRRLTRGMPHEVARDF
ncbi:YrhK family protein [Actinomycetospora chiangmaiensis]|uniref:YrhK family protein n=1 Tax=Actinomycetospora chiangmaiensis TaxID=402650 RepID=UPI00037838BE|nr:YrhK family protein [Actinomycetospora chiangmaiensis]